MAAQELAKLPMTGTLHGFFMSRAPADVMHIYSTSMKQFCKAIDKLVALLFVNAAAVHHTSIINRRNAAWLARQQRLNGVPLKFSQIVSSHDQSPPESLNHLSTDLGTVYECAA